MRESILIVLTGSVICVLLMGPTPTDAIECWTCSSDESPKCDPFDPKSNERINCDHTNSRNKPTLCKKVKKYNSSDKSWFVERGCADNGHRHDAQPGCKSFKSSPHNNNETTCYCNTNVCNSSTILDLNIHIFALFMGLGYTIMNLSM